MSGTVRYAPSFTAAQAADLAAGHLGFTADPVRMSSERDQNFRLDVDGHPAYVLKIANPAEDATFLEAQHRVLHWLETHAPGVGVPRVVPARDGSEIVTVPDGNGVPHLVRVLTWLPGTVLAEHKPPRPPALLESVGGFLGALTTGLVGFRHPASARRFPWDLGRGVETVRERIELVDGGDRRALLHRLAARLAADVEPGLAGLRRSVIHNDANDHNLLTDGDPRVNGIIDFGDMVYSVTAAEPAVGAAYALLDEPEPLAAAGYVVRGFDRAFPLLPEEKRVLFDLMLLRLAVSVSVCAEQKQLRPDDPYLTVSERPAWSALERLARVDPDEALTLLFDGAASA